MTGGSVGLSAMRLRPNARGCINLVPPERRKKLVIVGDAETTNGLAEHGRDAEILVIEATFLDRDAAIARDYGHITAAEAAALAAMSNIRARPNSHFRPPCR